MISIVGSHGEGGGQIIRTALALSALTGQPFTATNIRRGRDKPGLKAQHLSGILALQKLAQARAVGASIGSQSLEFYPGELKAGTITVDIGTAGSVTLLLQSLLLPSFFAGSRVRFSLTGGTDVPFSPTADYLMHVLLPQLRKFTEKIEVRLLRRGYVPAGGGKMELVIRPRFSRDDALSLPQEEHTAVHLTKQGSLLQVRGISHASQDLQKASVAERQARAAKQSLLQLGCPVSIAAEYCETASIGSGITLWASFADNGGISHLNPVILGSSTLGQRGKRAEDVGKEAATALIQEISSKAAADKHLADQLIPFLAIFGGSITASAITDHTRSNIYAVEQFLGQRIQLQEKNILASFK